MRPPAFLLAGLLATGAVAATLALAAPEAQALPVFGPASIETDSSLVNGSPGACPDSPNAGPQQQVDLVENGDRRSVTASNQGRLTNGADAGDVIEAAIAITGSAQVTSSGGDPRTVDLAGVGSVSVTTSRPSSVCRLMASSSIDMFTEFTVAHAGFLTLTTRASSSAHGGLLINDSDRDEVVALQGRGHTFDGNLTVFLPPGVYTGFLSVRALVDSNVAVASTPVDASVHAEFALAGSLLTPIAGEGRRYAALPASRTCAGHTLVATITDRGKQAHRIRKVQFFVNGALVQKVRSPGKGAAVPLGLPDGARAAVRAEVTLFPARKGRPAKVRTTSATYEACS